MSTKHSLGFTLIEVLVALVLTSTMALLAWRGLDGMGTAVLQTATHNSQTQLLSATLAQWQADWDATITTPVAAPLDYDGQALVLTRTSNDASAGVIVAAWTLRDGMLQRYASAPVQTQANLTSTWQDAKRWTRTPLPQDTSHVTRLLSAQQMSLFYYRGDAWSNPMSSPDTAQASIPDGVRWVLVLPAGQGLSGNITRDWVQPALGATR